MYLVGQGHEHLGPGTSMVQRINWTTGDEFTLKGAQLGLGCAAGCGCDGGCTKKGLGLFDSGFDPTTFGWPEWLVVGLGGYMATSMFFGTGRAIGRARPRVRGAVKRGRQRLGKRIAGD
jgi:hypothetical protein